MKALDTFNPKDTAIAEQAVSNVLKNLPMVDSAATITMTANLNDTVIYKTKSSTEQVAVFSEVYYDKGWDAYVDGKKTPYAKVNYVLRGMMVPAGEHTIEFRFEPESHITGWKITGATEIFMIIILVVAMFWEVGRKSKQRTIKQV